MERVRPFLAIALSLLLGFFGEVRAQESHPPGIEVNGQWQFGGRMKFATGASFICRNPSPKPIHLLPIGRIELAPEASDRFKGVEEWVTIKATSFTCAPGEEITLQILWPHFEPPQKLQLAFCDTELPADTVYPGNAFDGGTLSVFRGGQFQTETNARCHLVSIPRATIDAIKWATIPPALGQPQSEWFQAAQRLHGHKELTMWARGRLKRYETTLDEALKIFGEPLAQEAWPWTPDLDRPERDGLITLQFPIPQEGLYSFFILHFNAKDKTLHDTEIGFAICGFCPHVYAFDGNWRLEGKMLAGSVGRENAGRDTLLLPRLRQQDGRLRIMVANLAPEEEQMRDLKLASIPLQVGEELDIDSEGNPAVWTPTQEFEAIWERGSLTAQTSGSQLLVLEVKNTAEFETAMRRVFLDGQVEPRETNLRIQFDNGAVTHVRPVGTKLLRRVVVEVPPGATQARIVAEGDFWSMRRFWTGMKGNPERTTEWSASSPQGSMTLHPMEKQVLEFPAPDKPLPEGWHWGYCLKMSGYYDFIREAANP